MAVYKKNTTGILLYVKKDLRRAVDHLKDKHGMSLNQMVNLAIIKFLEENGGATAEEARAFRDNFDSRKRQEVIDPYAGEEYRGVYADSDFIEI